MLIRGRAQSRLYAIAAVGVAALVLAGFARSYYLRAFLTARVIAPLVHVHGLLMTSWIALFVTQSLLIANGRRDTHRRIGVAGAGIAVVAVIVGSLTVAGAIHRRVPGADTLRFWRKFVEFDGLSLWVFGCLTLAAILWRQRPDIHKRLLLAATVSLLPPAVGRIAEWWNHDSDFTLIAAFITCAFMLICATVDSLQQGRLHPAMLAGAVSVIGANLLTHWSQIGD